MSSGNLLRPEAAAELLGCSVNAVRVACAEGRLSWYRIGREGRIDPDLSGFHRPPPLRVPRAVRQPVLRKSGPTFIYPGSHRHEPAQGFVYFIGPEDPSTPIKVGWSVRAEGRVGSLQTGCWLPLVVHGSVAAFVGDEEAVHAELAAYRVRGEWFERERALALLADFEWWSR